MCFSASFAANLDYYYAALGFYSCYNRPARVISCLALWQITESRYWHSKTWPSDHRYILRDRAFEIAAVNIEIFVSQNQTRCVFPRNPAVWVVSLVLRASVKISFDPGYGIHHHSNQPTDRSYRRSVFRLEAICQKVGIVF